MSNALAIAGVTAVLRDLLHEGLIDHDLPSDVSNVKVTSEPPDIITTGPNEEDRLNLFFYQAIAQRGLAQRRTFLRATPQGAASPTRRSRSTCTTC